MSSIIAQIQEDYVVGDSIRISCTLGVKEGIIVSFMDNRIKLRPLEPGRKPMSISEETITDWEELVVDHGNAKESEANSDHQETSANLPEVQVDAPKEMKVSEIKEETVAESKEEPVPEPVEAVPEPVEEQNEEPASQPMKEPEEEMEESAQTNVSAAPVPTFGPEITHKPDDPDHVLGHLDLDALSARYTKKAEKTNTTNHSKDFASPSILDTPQPASTVSERFPTLVKGYRQEAENGQMVKAVGYIALDKKDYGLIWDQQSQEKIWFSSNDICDDDLFNQDNWVGIQVAYFKTFGSKGAKAVGICLPHPVYEMLAMVDDVIDDDSYSQEAYDILQTIKAQYPKNEDLRDLESRLRSKVIKRPTHSPVSPLNPISMSKSSDMWKAKGPKVPKVTETGKEKSFSYDMEYKRAKSFTDKREHKQALVHYLNAYAMQRKPTVIKDICTTYCALCSKKYLDEHPGELPMVETYRSKGRKFLADNIDKLPDEPTTYNFLETTYFVLHEYQKFVEVINKLIPAKSPSTRIILMNKKAAALLALDRRKEAEETLRQVLSIDSENQTAKRLQEQLKSNNAEYDELESLLSDSETSDTPISPFLLETIDKFNNFVGIPNYILADESRLYSESTYNSIENQLNGKNISSDSQKRSLLLLTKAKIRARIMPNNNYDKRELALYCNDMARIAITRNPNSVVWDVVRFYFNESFSLTTDWRSVIRQFIQYLETLIPTKRDNIFGQLKHTEAEQRVSEDIHEYVVSTSTSSFDMDWLDGLLHPSLYNLEIARRVAEEICKHSDIKTAFVTKLKNMGKDQQALDTNEQISQAWKDLIDERFASETSLKNSFLTRTKHTLLQRLNSSMESLSQESRVTWLFGKDKERIRQVFRSLVPKVDAFINSQSYSNKEDNFQDAERLVQILRDDITANPTKFSYEALLPLLMHFQKLLTEEWEKIELYSKPKVEISLLTQSAYKDDCNWVGLQIAVANHKDSSPISRIQFHLLECEEIETYECEDSLHIDYLKGGEKPIIFHVRLKLKPQFATTKAFSVKAQCTYETTKQGRESSEQELAVRLYSQSEYQRFDNPYNAGDTVERRDMFFGRDAFINNLVNVMQSSHSKQLVFYGQKRSGKSSVLYWLQQELEAHGAFCARFSMGILRKELTDVTFFHQILQSIKNALRKYRNVLKPEFDVPRVEEFRDENPSNPVQTFAAYMAKFKEACQNTPGWENKLIVVMIDEFTYIYTGIKENRVDCTIMQQWKSVIQDPDSSFAAVLVGQDVIPYFKNEVYARNAFQMMEDYRLNYLEEPDARDLIEKPIGKERYASGAVDLILQYTSCNPYYIQMLCGELVHDMNKKKAIIATTADVADVANKIISRLTAEDFDNLISPGDAIKQIEEVVTEQTVIAVLYRIAKLTETTDFCQRSEIINFYREGLLENEPMVIDKVLQNLKMREVIDEKEGLYRIKVKLFQQWMLLQSPERASLKTQEK